MPTLHSLQCDEAHFEPNCFAPLPTSLSLTSVHFADAGFARSNLLPFVAAMLTLRCLSLLHPQLYSSAFLELCTSPALSSLEELRLADWIPFDQLIRAAISPDHLALGFAALRSLRVIRLAGVDDGGRIIEALRHAPALTQLFLRIDSDNWLSRRNSIEIALRGAPNRLCVEIVARHPTAPSTLRHLRSMVLSLRGFGADRVRLGERWCGPLES